MQIAVKVHLQIHKAMAAEDYSKSDSYKVEVDILVESLKSDGDSKINFSNDN